MVITIEDVNDNAPEMLKKAYRFKIPETQPVQEPLVQENSTATATAETAEIDELLDKKPWTCFGPSDIAGPALFRVSIVNICLNLQFHGFRRVIMLLLLYIR